MILRRKTKVDRDELGIPADERVIAAAATVSGRVVAATDRAFYPVSGERLKWSGIAAAEWEEPFLRVVLVDEFGRPSDQLRFELADGSGQLPAAVHDRVTASVVFTERADLPSGGTALFTAREDSDDSTIRWAVVFDAGVDKIGRAHV